MGWVNARMLRDPRLGLDHGEPIRKSSSTRAMRTPWCGLAVVAMAIWSLGCSAQRALPRAIVEPDQVERAGKVQAQLDDQSDSPPPDGNWFEERHGASPVVLTAPHATQVLRDGKPRMSDGGGTGALVLALQESVAPTVFYTTWMAPSDPNYADDSEFKLALARVLTSARVCVVLDIHGSHPFRPYDVDLGTMNGESLLGRYWYEEWLREELRDAGLGVLSGNRFAAQTNATITERAARSPA